MYTATQLVQATTRIVSLPDIYVRVRVLLNDPRATLADVGNVLSRDAGLTMRLLKIANSPFYGCAARVDTVSRAVALLGTRQIHDLVLATTAARTFSRMSSDAMNMDIFWRSSVYRAVLSRSIAKQCSVLDPERIFVGGLLSDVGHLVMYQNVPELGQQALMTALREQRPLIDVESELIGCDYAQVGGELASQWGLPEGLQEVLRYHPDPVRAQDYPLDVAIVHIAAVLTDSVGGLQASMEKLKPEAITLTQLGLEELEVLVHDAADHLEEAIDLLLPKGAVS